MAIPVPQLKTKFEGFQSHDFGGGYRTHEIDTDVPKNALTGGRDMLLAGNAPEKRQGHTVYGSISGFVTGILDLIPHEPPGGTNEFLRAYDTVLERYVSGTWTALTSVTLTTNLPGDHAFFPLTAKTYYLNGTDAVAKYASGSSGDQSDSSFKKGKYVVHYKNRLIVAGVSSQTDYFWYTDLGVDTFSSNNYVRVNGEITGLKVIYDKLLIFTRKKTYAVQNFSFNGVAAGPEAVIELRGDIGCVAHRTFQVVGNLGYFLGNSAEGIAAVYVTDGLTIGNVAVSDPIAPDFFALAPSQLSNASAGTWGRYYRLSLTPTGQTTNALEYLYDTSAKRWEVPQTNQLGGFSCYAQFTLSDQLFLFGGIQGSGICYKLNQVDYDESLYEQFVTVGSVDNPVDSSTSKRAAQSFKVNTANGSSVGINGAWVRLKKNAGTTTELTVRIETDQGGQPSGTLAHASATGTIAAITSTTYAYYEALMTGAELTPGVTYWIVVKHTTEATGNSQYYWSGHSSGTYSSGKASAYASSTSSNTGTYSPSMAQLVGILGSANQSFSALRSGASGNDIEGPGSAVTVYLNGDTGAANVYASLSRGYLVFDTSSIPDDASITAATVQLYVSYESDFFAQSAGLTAATPASDSSLVGTDYAVANFGSTRFATDLALASLSVNAYNTWTLNASGRAAISLTGKTRFGVRLSADIDNADPGNPTSSGLGSQFVYDTTGRPYPPILSVTYSTATGTFFWTAAALQDNNFALSQQGDIDGYCDTAALLLTPIGQKFHLRDLFVDAEASGDYNVQIGINTGEYSSFDYQDMSVASAGPIFGSTLVIGSSVLGGKLRSEQRLRWDAIRGYLLKVRFRNRFASQPFKVFGIRTRHEVLPKIK